MNNHMVVMLSEIICQCQYAIKAKGDMDRESAGIADSLANPSAGMAMVMKAVHRHRLRIGYSQQACLVALASVSKCLWANPRDRPEPDSEKMREKIRQLLLVDEQNILFDRSVRDCFEHIDARIDKVFEYPSSGISADMNITGGNALGGVGPGIETLRHLDFDTNEVSARTKGLEAISVNLDAAVDEVRRIKRALLDATTALSRGGMHVSLDLELEMTKANPDFEDLD